MALRSVQLVEAGSGERTQVGTVVGVDESGNPTGNAKPFVLAALRCPRSDSERLAKRLVQCGLHPWQNKSRSLAAVVDERNEQTRRVERFVEAISSDVASWSAAVGWQRYDLVERAAVACSVTSKALTTPHCETPVSVDGDAVLLHDGGENTYGANQRVLREQAATTFDASFQSSICPVFVAPMTKADLTYPEAIAADYLAGYVRERVAAGSSVETLPPQVVRIDTSWTEPTVAPASLFQVRTSGVSQDAAIRTRIAAWLEGRRPPKSTSLTNDSHYERLVARIQDDTLRTYLRSLSA